MPSVAAAVALFAVALALGFGGLAASTDTRPGRGRWPMRAALLFAASGAALLYWSQ